LPEALRIIHKLARLTGVISLKETFFQYRIRELEVKILNKKLTRQQMVLLLAAVAEAIKQEQDHNGLN